MADEDYDSVPAVRAWMRRADTWMTRTEESLERLEAKVDLTNGRVLRHSEIFFGPTDSRGEHTGKGLLWRVDDQGQTTTAELKDLRRDVNVLSRQTTGMSAGELRAAQVWRIVLAGAGVTVAAVGVLVSVLLALN